MEPRARQVVVRRAGVGASPGSGNVGIGIKFTESNGEHIVTSLREDGPADLTQQVFEGDKIVAVDGVELVGKSCNEVIDLILGPLGLDVVLTLASSDYLRQDFLSPVAPNTHTSNGLAGSTPNLRSIDSPPSKEFGLLHVHI